MFRGADVMNRARTGLPTLGEFNHVVICPYRERASLSRLSDLCVGSMSTCLANGNDMSTCDLFITTLMS